MDINIKDSAGKKVGSIKLDPAIFDSKKSPAVVHEIVRWQRAAKRQGTHKCLTRGEMEWGGKKPWKQKGTGRARAGTATSPVWVGGAVAHGPSPRDYSYSMPKKKRRKALATVLAEKLSSEALHVIDELKLETGKTKDLAKILDSLKVGDKGVTIVLPEQNEMISRSAKNLPGVKTLPVEGVNVYDLLLNKEVLCTKEALEKLQARIKGELNKESVENG